MKNKTQIIHINWEKYDYSEKTIKKLCKGEHKGIYQVYGAHPVYGLNTLLYIGKARDNNFATRLSERTEFYESIIRPTELRIGMLYKIDDMKSSEWPNLIDISEKMLIKAHAPAYNSQEIKGLYWKEGDKIVDNFYLIKNWGDYGLLLPEISSFNVSYRYWEDFNNGEQYFTE